MAFSCKFRNVGAEDCGKLHNLINGGEDRTIEEIMADFNSKSPTPLHFYACTALEFLTAIGLS